MRNLLLVLFTFSLVATACREPIYTPKPRGYFQIDFPEKKYTQFNNAGYPYAFEYPVYGTIEKDTMFFEEKTENPWWININFKTLGGVVFMSYKEINGANNLEQLLEDSYNLSHYHTKKADYINEPVFHTENNVHGIFYDVGGEAASAFQFFATDSNKHWIRGALYFDVAPNADSLKPMNEFLREDIVRMVKSIKWK
jgi:gliding motility-associated lipoprotein GldD